VFVGTGGPYFRDNKHPDPANPNDPTKALDGGDGVIDQFDTPAADGATGVAFSNIGFGLALMRTQTSARSFYALEASGSGSRVGVRDVTLDAKTLSIVAKGGKPATAGGAPVAVNFSKSFPAGLPVKTGPNAGDTIVLGGPTDAAGVFNKPILSAS